jgi:hypothetical protein
MDDNCLVIVTINCNWLVTNATEVNCLAIGIVSTNPAFMMNKDLVGGTYIALKGRVPVKVTGAVKKGDRLVAGPAGTALVRQNFNVDTFAIALESSDVDGITTIEALVL